MINLRKGPVLDQLPLRLKRTCNLHPRWTRAHSPPIHTTGTRTGTFCKDDDDSDKVSASFDAFSGVTDWAGKISGMSYKSDRCDRCVMFQLCSSFLFLRLAGLTPAVIWESWTAYSMWAIMIFALITFSIQKQSLLWRDGRLRGRWCSVHHGDDADHCNLSGTNLWERTA